MPFKSQRIRDPIHNLIEFRGNEFESVLWNVVQTRPFQRLRRVKQLGFSDLVYPGASHSRFAHSLGVFHTARLLMDRVKAQLSSSRYRDSNAEAALAAALVHDLGHGPFSHAFEEVGERLSLKMAKHEDVSVALITEGEVAEELSKLGSGFAKDVAGVLTNEGKTIYSTVVSSQFDADRLDYMRRDRFMCGTGIGVIDFEWLLANLEVADVPFGVDEKKVGTVETFVIGPKGIHAAEAYVLGLFQLYPTVYFHKATRGAQKLFTELLERTLRLAIDRSVDKTGLDKDHPLVTFARNPNDVANVLPLDDTLIWGSLSQMVSADDALIRTFATRLRDRKLYKVIDVRERVTERFGMARQRAVDKACAEILLKIKRWKRGVEDGIPRLLVDEAERNPYKRGPVNQILVRPSGSQPVDITKKSEALRGLRPFKISRVYYREEDAEARKYVETIIRRETENGKRH